MARILAALLLAFCTLCAGVSGALASGVDARASRARDGEASIGACLTLSLPAGRHAYAHSPGDAGRPTDVLFYADERGPLPVHYPEGTLQPDYYDKSAQVSVYEGTVRLYVPLPGETAGRRWRATVSLLLCSALNCTPVDLPLSGTVPSDPQPLEQQPWKDDWFAAAAAGRAVPPMEPAFPFSLDAGPASTLPIPAAPDDGQEPMPAPEGFDFTLNPVYADDGVEIYGFGKALLFGILAGLILNVMPCVLPVLSFKMTGMLMASGRDPRHLRAFRQHNVFFAAGILTLFTLLALVLGLMDMMWGQLYQSQEFLLVMLMMVFLMGLSMMGVFTLPVVDLKALSRETSSPRLQAYLTGLLATFLATPCSGPLLGGVLSWAFTQPLPILVAVFWAVGLGMSLPYLVLSAFPRLALALPRPGSWMLVFEHILGFMLLGTALYLLSILPESKYIPVLGALLVCALSAFLWEHLCTLQASRLRRFTVSACFVAVLVGSAVFALNMERTRVSWTPFTLERFTRDLGVRPMVVEFTADWCPNCKYVEATVFTEHRLNRIRTQYGATFLRVDLTDANAAGSKLLDMLGSRSIPLTAIIPAGPDSSRPLVLRDVFTASTFEKAVRAALAR